MYILLSRKFGETLVFADSDWCIAILASQLLSSNCSLFPEWGDLSTQRNSPRSLLRDMHEMLKELCYFVVNSRAPFILGCHNLEFENFVLWLQMEEKIINQENLL